MQDKAESIDRYVTGLRLIAKNCNFRDLEDELIRDRIVCGVNSDDVKQQLLRVQDFTLDKALTICRADKQSKKHIQYLSEELDIEHVHGVTTQTRNTKFDTKRSPSFKPSSKNHEDGQKQNPICGNCGLQHARKQCPAYGKQCRKCGKLNHFQKWCRNKKKVSVVTQDDESHDKLFVGVLTKDVKTDIRQDE